MQSEKITFAGALGAELAARLDKPEGPVRAAAILAHCFTCSKDIAAARRIAGRLAARGIAVLRFDFTGLGHSEGEFASTNFSSNVADLLAAATWMEAQDMAPQLLIGHSLGGAAALKAAPRIASLRAVVTIGAPVDPSHVTHNFGDKLDEIRANGSAQVNLGGRPFEIRRQFLDDISEASLADALPRLGAALLVLHAPRDEVVGIDNAAAIFTAARHPKSFVSLDDADHLVSREADAEYVAELISSWSARYLDLAPEPKRAETPEGVVRVAEAEASGFRQDITIGGQHQLVADEPAAMGGTNLGPSPYQLLSAALGACTTMTIRLYARRKAIALTHVACDVIHNKSHKEDCEDCEKRGPRIDVFRRQIRLEGDITEEQRAALLAIADKCPVHRTLHEQAIIETELV
ncbi:MAG: osmotically inducible protein C [Alphaproteobacteria bacterium HGW-Alphaproteobacteria-11]|nr:MAG: osmotically inducible protein C [Alphaproteobacteria bacterium HGW-Alphaproteobacteria-11]